MNNSISKFFILIFFLITGHKVYAGTGQLDWVEVDVKLRADGKVSLTYYLRFKDINYMSGFYFQGWDKAPPHFDVSKAYAVDDNKNTYPLEIRNLGDKFDIVLAQGRRIPRGSATFIFTYGADFASAGYLAYTKDAAGKELVVLNWAPVQWDEPLSHYTVYLEFPFQVAGEVLSVEEKNKIDIRTEKWMNKEYLIDYKGRKTEGVYKYVMQLHKKNAPTKYHMRIQLYVNREIFEGIAEYLKQIER